MSKYEDRRSREKFLRREMERIREEFGDSANKPPVIGVGWYRGTDGKIHIA